MSVVIFPGQVLRDNEQNHTLDDIGDLGLKTAVAAKVLAPATSPSSSPSTSQTRLAEIEQAVGKSEQELKAQGILANRDSEEIDLVIEVGPNQWTNPVWVSGFAIYACGRSNCLGPPFSLWCVF